MLKTYDDATCETQVAPRRRSEAGQVLSALARNMDHDNGLRSIFYSIAVMADYELWSIEDCLNNMRTNWSESLEKSQATIDQLAADVSTLQNERDKLLRELAETQEAYRKAVTP